MSKAGRDGVKKVMTTEAGDSGNIEKRGGHPSSGKSFGKLPVVTGRPAAGVSRPTADASATTPATNPAPKTRERKLS